MANAVVQPLERKQAQQALEAQRRPAAMAADKGAAGGAGGKKTAGGAAGGAGASGHGAAAGSGLGGGLKSTAPPAAPLIPDEDLPPNTTLFLRDLPDDAEADTLIGLFGRFDAFKEVRMVPGRKGIAFVEFETLEGAISAKEGMGGMVLGNSIIKVTYQRQ